MISKVIHVNTYIVHVTVMKHMCYDVYTRLLRLEVQRIAELLQLVEKAHLPLADYSPVPPHKKDYVLSWPSLTY